MFDENIVFLHEFPEIKACVVLLVVPLLTRDRHVQPHVDMMMCQVEERQDYNPKRILGHQRRNFIPYLP